MGLGVSGAQRAPDVGAANIGIETFSRCNGHTTGHFCEDCVNASQNWQPAKINIISRCSFRQISLAQTLISAAQTPSLDYSHYPVNAVQSVDRGATREERRHQRECFILCSALGTMLDLCAADFIGNSLCVRLRGTAALPSLRKGCAPIAASHEESRLAQP